MNPIDASLSRSIAHLHVTPTSPVPQYASTAHVASSVAPSENPQDIPSRITLNGRSVRIGSFKLSEEKHRTLLASLLRPQGSVTELADATSKSSPEGSDAWYVYEAKTTARDPSESIHGFKVKIQVDTQGQLKHLIAQSATHAPYNDENSAFSLGFNSIAGKSLTLTSLPNELLLQIAENTGRAKNKVNLNLRAVNRQLKWVSDDKLSLQEHFVMRNGQTLEAAGYNSYQMKVLAGRSTAGQNFILTNGHTLKEAGYGGHTMNYLASRPIAEHNFVLENAQTLEAAGYRAIEMNHLASRPTAEQNFILTNAQTLKAAGYNANVMSDLAGRPIAEQNFILTNAQTLKAAGYDGDSMNDLARQPADIIDAVLHNRLASLPADVIEDFLRRVNE